MDLLSTNGNKKYIKYTFYAIFIFAILLINLISVFNTDENMRAKWDGIRYQIVINEYINNGYSFSNIKANGIEENFLKQEYVNRIAYIWLIGQTKKLTNANISNISLFYSLLFFTLTGFVIFLYTHKFFNFSEIESLLCATTLVLMPGISIIFEIATHPEAPFMFFSILAIYGFKKESHILAISSIVLAILFKVGAILIPIYVSILLLLKTNQENKQKNINLSIYYLLTLITALIPSLICPKVYSLSNSLFVFDSIINYNKESIVPFFLNNFQLLTIPFIIHFFSIKIEEKIAISSVLIIGFIAHIYNAVDWWRVWFGLIFIWVIPLSFKQLISYKSVIGQNGVYLVLLAIIITFCKNLGPLNLNEVKIFHQNYYLIFIVLLIFFEYLKQKSIKIIK